ncbi:MAG TPA: Fe-S protein assembly co-chaperone HscB [Phycisphaerae bacterium]|nr:Fe-S protein assembly co-chaperone HscB [Phycisphaerae bacterium]
MESPVACASCGALGQLPTDTFDCFELFGLERAYDVNHKALHRKYLALSRVIHPDIAGTDAPEQRHQALDLCAELNRAYETLRDPVARAEYMLALAGGPKSSEMKAVPQSLLGEVLVLRESIEEARETGDAAMLQSLKAEISAKRQEILGRIAELARTLDCWDAPRRRELREQLNIIKYYGSLLDQIPVNVPMPTRDA